MPDPTPDPMDAALDKAAGDSSPPPVEVPASQPEHKSDAAATSPVTAPAGSGTPAPTPRKFKAKFDHEEKDVDWDEWTKEQEGKGRLKEIVERDYGFDRRITRATEEAWGQANDKYGKWLARHNLELVRDPNDPDGWKPVPKQAATPAQPPADPLAIEEQQLLPKVKEGDPEAVLRIAEIRAERKILARETERNAKEAEARRKTDEQQTYSQRMSQLRTKIQEAVDARAKSFDLAPDKDARKQRVISAAISNFFSEKGDLKTALALVADEANGIDAMHADWAKKATTDGRPTPPPVIGATPSGNGQAKKPDLRTPEGWESALDQSIEAASHSRR